MRADFSLRVSRCGTGFSEHIQDHRTFVCPIVRARHGVDTTQFKALGSPPACPKCGSSMHLRTARRGRNAGNQFWGCSRYPICKGIQNLHEEPTKVSRSFPKTDSVADAPVEPRPFLSLPVGWVEGAARSEYVPEYVSVGAMPGVFREELAHLPDLERTLSQCLLLTPRRRPRLRSLRSRGPR